MAGDVRAALEELLTRAAEAHHEYEVGLGAPDPDWPAWYAAWLVENGVGSVLQTQPGEASLTRTLVEAETAYERADRAEPWQAYYAAFIEGRYRDSA